MAEGVLVMPGVVKPGMIVSPGVRRRALRVGGKTVSCSRLTSGSIDCRSVVKLKTVVILFMRVEPLEQFQASKEWEVGIDGNVARANFGGGKRVGFITMNEPVIGFVADVNGLMAYVTLKGAKFTKINPKCPNDTQQSHGLTDVASAQFGFEKRRGCESNSIFNLYGSNSPQLAAIRSTQTSC